MTSHTDWEAFFSEKVFNPSSYLDAVRAEYYIDNIEVSLPDGISNFISLPGQRVTVANAVIIHGLHCSIIAYFLLPFQKQIAYSCTC